MAAIERVRQEVDPRPALRAPRPIPILSLTTSMQTLATARADADFEVVSLVAVHASAGTHDVTIYLVPPAGSPAVANAIVVESPITTNKVLVIAGRENPLLVPPGYTLQAICDTDNAVNIYGHGYDYQGLLA